MTTLADKLVEAAVTEMLALDLPSKDLFRAARAVLLAVLPMVAEEIGAAIVGEIGPTETMPGILVNYGVANANGAARARITAILADLAREG